MKVTRDIVIDLWPLYVEGEASPDTRAQIESYLAEHPEFSRRMQEDTGDAILKPAAISLPPNLERETLLRTQRRRACSRC